MNLAKGPRPWSIWLFALILLAAALWHLLGGLVELFAWYSLLETVSPTARAEFDSKIIQLSTLFTIAVIPIVAIWLFASKIARWLVTIAGCVMVADQVYSIGSFAMIGQFSAYFENNGHAVITPLAMGIGAALLFMPSAVEWLNTSKERGKTDAAVFE